VGKGITAETGLAGGQDQTRKGTATLHCSALHLPTEFGSSGLGFLRLISASRACDVNPLTEFTLIQRNHLDL